MTTKEIAALLDYYSSAVLQTMARARGVSLPKNPKKAFNLESVLASIENKVDTERIYAALPQDSKILLTLLREAGGETTLTELKIAAKCAGVPQFDSHLQNLMTHALVLYASPAAHGVHEIWNPSNPKYHWQPGGFTKLRGMPLAMTLADAEITPPVLATALEKCETAPARKDEQSPSLVLHGLHVVAGRAREAGLPFTTKNQLAKPALKKLSKELGAEEQWANFLCDLAYSAGLITLEARNLTLTASAPRFFALPPAAQVQRLLVAWFTLQNLSELELVPEIRVTSTPAYLNSYSYYPDDVPSPEKLALARSFLIGLLKRTQLGENWYSLASLISLVKEQDREFLMQHPRQAHSIHDHYTGIWHVTSHQYARNGLKKSENWEVVEGGFIREVLRGPLRWLGLMEIGYDEAGTMVAFRPTALGLGALGLAPLPAEPPPDESARALVVQPNFEIVAYTEPQFLAVLYQLERFADRIRLERVAHYKLTRDSVHRGLQGGLTSTAMLEFLSQNSRNEVPQNIAYSLEDWQQTFNRVHVYRQTTLVEAGSESELDAALRGIPAEAITRLGPLWAMVIGEETDAVKKRLAATKDASLLDYAAPVRQAYTIDEQFNIDVPAENLDMWLQSRFELFCDVQQQPPNQNTSAVRFQMTRETVERAAKTGWKPDAILAFLRETGPLTIPADMELSLRGWGNKIAPVALCPAVALVVEPGLLADLIQVDELHDLFWLKVSDNVVLVREDDVAALRAALEKRGIVTGAGLDIQLKAPVKPRQSIPMSSSLPGHRRIDPKTGGRLLVPTPASKKRGALANETRVAPDQGKDELWAMLQEAIEKRRGVEITYRHKSRKYTRLVIPEELSEFGDQRFLYAWDTEKDTDREYEFADIMEVLVTDQEFDPDEFNYLDFE